jgi:di/tricarboxylate transporter
VALATALEFTGGARLIADTSLALMGGAGPAVILSGLFLVMAVLTNVLSNNATAVLFTPIALSIANGLGISPEPFIAAVIFAANSSFATPIGYQTNLLVMGPGHYRFSDFLRAGTPLVIIIWLTFSLLAPWYYGI